MDIKLNPNIAASPVYVGGASVADMKKAYGLDAFIKLASNESPFGPSPKAVAAMQQALAGLNRYPPAGDESLRQALARHLGGGMQADNFVTGNSGCDVLNMVSLALLNPGEGCVICRPTFPVYDITARRAGAEVTYVDLNPTHFQYDVEAILGAVTDQTRLVYLCSPNNPTGVAISAGQLETLIAHLPPQVVLVYDEVYYHFADAADRPDSLSYVRAGENIIVLHSFSKAYGLAGLRLGYGIAPAPLAEYLSRNRQPFHLSSLVIEGGIAALDDADYIQNTVAAVIAERAWLYRELGQLGLPVWPSQANFVLFKPPFAAAEISERLLRRGLIVRPMDQFYLPTHLRVSVGLPEENRRFIEALTAILAELAAEGAPSVGEAAEAGGQFKF
jgi:histidinol-phosphate aminotransferase